MVICRYSESLNWLLDSEVDYIVYNKGVDNLSYLEQTKIVRSENKGRESETWLRYIKENYDNLPDFIFFLQGNPFDHKRDCLDIIKNHNPCSDFIPLGGETHTNPIDKTGYPGLRVFDFMKEILPSSKFEDNANIYFVAGAQFIVSKNLIKKKPKYWWVDLYNYHLYYLDSGIFSGYGMSPGLFICHVFERLWFHIFNSDFNGEKIQNPGLLDSALWYK